MGIILFFIVEGTSCAAPRGWSRDGGVPVNWEYELLAEQLDKGGALRALIRTGPALAVAAGIYPGAARWALELRWKTPAPKNSSGKPRHNLLSLPRRNAAAGEWGLSSTHKHLSLSSGRGGSRPPSPLCSFTPPASTREMIFKFYFLSCRLWL